MDNARVLSGSCDCKRNQFTVTLPGDDAANDMQFFLDTSPTSRRIHAAPLIAYLRVPLAWYHSTTHSQYADETHSSIRRVYHAAHPSRDRRQFCGFCGSQLSSWSEGDGEGGPDAIFLTLESLHDEDLGVLEGLGLLPPTTTTDEAGSGFHVKGFGARAGGEVHVRAPGEAMWQRGASWFETVIESSDLGRHVRRQRRVHATEDGRVRIEYEIVEVEDGSREGVLTGKRKFDASEDQR